MLKRWLFGPEQVITTQARSAKATTATDADGDGDIDVASAYDAFSAGTVAWYENREFGDANNDGRFDRLDLVRLLQAGEFEDGTSENSSFEESDWNGDGDFTAEDLVFALQLGKYVT